jgi:hypothetical protein
METFTEYSDCNCEDLITEAAEYKGREVTLITLFVPLKIRIRSLKFM